MKHQRDNIRSIFLSRPNQDIPLPELMKYAVQYNARIFELRGEGMRIVNIKKRVNGEWHSWFRHEPVETEATGQLCFSHGGKNAQ